MGTGDCTLVIFAKPPIAGRVKTRLFRAEANEAHAHLGRILSAENAANLYAAFLRDLLARGVEAGFRKRRLYIAGELQSGGLPELAAANGYELRVQVGDDLGERMNHALSSELAEGAPGVVLIGSDSPTLPALYLAKAAAALGSADVVLGPANDGGYYLIGARTPIPTIFAPGIAWGTNTVLERTLERLAALEKDGKTTVQLPTYYDVDTPADVRWLIAHLRMLGEQSAPSTAAVLRMWRML